MSSVFRRIDRFRLYTLLSAAFSLQVLVATAIWHSTEKHDLSTSWIALVVISAILWTVMTCLSDVFGLRYVSQQRRVAAPLTVQLGKSSPRQAQFSNAANSANTEVLRWHQQISDVSRKD